jgi:hypothetical protein
MTDGSIEKVQIFAYTDKEFRTPNNSVPQPFYIPINPENYSKTFKIKTDDRRGHGNEGTDPRYESTAPEELKLDFLLDGTEAIEGYRYTDPDKKPVKEQLHLFLETVYRMEEKIHRPNFLKVIWGECLAFACVLSNLDLQYTLFEANGDPLRVKISATFLKCVGDAEIEARSRTCSPDLTHLRTVKAGDRLDLMTYNIYNDARYLLQVAKVNSLSTVRRVKPGAELRFPPLQKPGTS